MHKLCGAVVFILGQWMSQTSLSDTLLERTNETVNSTFSRMMFSWSRNLAPIVIFLLLLLYLPDITFARRLRCPYKSKDPGRDILLLGHQWAHFAVDNESWIKPVSLNDAAQFATPSSNHLSHQLLPEFDFVDYRIGIGISRSLRSHERERGHRQRVVRGIHITHSQHLTHKSRSVNEPGSRLPSHYVSRVDNGTFCFLFWRLRQAFQRLWEYLPPRKASFTSSSWIQYPTWRWSSENEYESES